MAVGSDPIAQYSYRDMIGAIVLRPRPTTFLRDLFVKREQQHRTKYIELDKVSGGRMIARYTNRDGGPAVVGKAGYANVIHVAPYVYEEVPYTPSDVDTRLAGDDPYAPAGDPAARLVAGWLADLEDRLIRLEEQQVAQAIQTGKITVSGADVSYLVDFQQAAGNLITLLTTARWSQTATRDILGNLKTWSQLIINSGAPAPDVLIMDTTAASYVLSDTTVLARLDNRRVIAGEIRPQQIRDQNATYLGNLAWDGFSLDLYVYQGSYQYLSAGTPTSAPYMTANQVVLASTAMDSRMHYGKIENFRAPNYMGKRLPYQYESPNGRNRYVAMESSPMFGLHQPEGFVSVLVHS